MSIELGRPIDVEIASFNPANPDIYSPQDIIEVIIISFLSLPSSILLCSLSPYLNPNSLLFTSLKNQPPLVPKKTLKSFVYTPKRTLLSLLILSNVWEIVDSNKSPIILNINSSFLAPLSLLQVFLIL